MNNMACRSFQTVTTLSLKISILSISISIHIAYRSLRDMIELLAKLYTAGLLHS